ncbi:zinc finger domain-containing protein [Micromonospora globbae]|uniref:zinc finger domain-containing protein n=1 Tax=Micromonospora globbae TaxID=1894969 RepID=UPI003B8A8FB2
MKFYKNHRCEKVHQTYLELMKCMKGRKILRIYGEGPYALFSCPVPRGFPGAGKVEISLHDDYVRATITQDRLNKLGCGSGCKRSHEIVRMVNPPEAVSWGEPPLRPKPAGKATCPTCKAGPGEPCVTYNGKGTVKGSYHRLRVGAAWNEVYAHD